MLSRQRAQKIAERIAKESQVEPKEEPIQTESVNKYKQTIAEADRLLRQLRKSNSQPKAQPTHMRPTGRSVHQRKLDKEKERENALFQLRHGTPAGSALCIGRIKSATPKLIEKNIESIPANLKQRKHAGGPGIFAARARKDSARAVASSHSLRSRSAISASQLTNNRMPTL